MTALSLPAIRDLLAGVTPGEWAVEFDNADDYEAGISYGDYPYCIRGPLNVTLTASDLEKPYWQEDKNRVSEISELSHEDAAFIAAAPSIVAQLVGVVERVEGLAKYLDRLAPGDKHYAGLIRAALTGEGQS